MKTKNPTENRRDPLKHLALALMFGVGLGAGSAQAQAVIEVGGVGVIGDQALTTGSLPTTIGANWSAPGGDGNTFSSLISPTSLAVVNTGTVTLTFTHRYSFESGWDGGAVYVNVNGAGFNQVLTADFSSNGYDGLTANSVWTGEEVFTGTSAGYATPALITSVASLGSLTAGDTVEVEFRGGWDVNTNDPAPNWEIATVDISDTGANLLSADFTANGPSGFTATTTGTGTSPWGYPNATNRFEIDADLLTADRYAPVSVPSVIDLNGANIEVALLAGTLDIGDSFTLFDLSGGTTLTGSVGTLKLPPGTWDTSNLATAGTITILDTASPLIYEPFADLDSSLNGNTPGLGLTGTWSSGALVGDSSLTYGKLGYQGGRVVSNPGNSIDKGWVSPGTTLTDAGLLDDGATLWISVLIKKYPDTSATTNDRTTYFSLGTNEVAPDGFDRIGGNTGSGFAFVVNQGNNGTSDRLQLWNNDSDGAGGAEKRSPSISWGPEGSTILAVGKITWGAFDPNTATAIDNDVFELYLPDKDLNLGPVVATLTANFDQNGTVAPANAFNTIGFVGKRGATGENNTPEIDEFRFAANVADVLPLDFAAPLLVSTDNASGASTQRSANFDEELYVGTGDIRIVNETTPGTTTITLPDPQVVLSGNTLTITPTVPLSAGDTFHIEIDAGALTDRNLNGFAGISDPDLWEFTVDNTPPTVVSFGDNTSPKPILTNTSRLVYTVTFSEPIDAGTVEIADFAATAGSVPITVDSVTATGPAVFEVAVSTQGTSGTLALEIVASAVIKDVNGVDLDTTTAIPSDNTLTVNDPVPNGGSLTNDFQGTIASQGNAATSSEARYFHVSVNPANPGTGWYGADLPGTGDDAPAGWRNYTGPVVAYKFLGNGGNGNVTSTAGSGGEDTRITYTTDDLTFDGYGQQQLRLWTTNDPGADLATGAAGSATGFASIGNYGYRDWQGATGIVNISGLASGSVHIYYGAYSSTPTLKVTMRDTDNVGADVVILDAHSIADGGNGDAANSCEYYLAEIDFVSDGVYDSIEYEWYSSNGRGLGTVLTGPDVVVGTDYATWLSGFTLTDTTFDGDDDGDNLGNGIEGFFGTDPSTSSTGLAEVSKSGADTVTFTHPNPDAVDVLTDVTGSYEWSPDLVTWYADDGAEGPGATTVTTVATPDSPAANTTTVVATIGGPVPEKLFLRVVATQP